MFLTRPLPQSPQRGLPKRRNRQARPLHRRILRQIHDQLLIRSLRRNQRQLPLLDLQPQLNLLRILKARRRLLHRQLRRSPLHRNRRLQQLQSQSHIQLRLHRPKNRRQNTLLKIKRMVMPRRRPECPGPSRFPSDLAA